MSDQEFMKFLDEILDNVSNRPKEKPDQVISKIAKIHHLQEQQKILVQLIEKYQNQPIPEDITPLENPQNKIRVLNQSYEEHQKYLEREQQECHHDFLIQIRKTNNENLYICPLCESYLQVANSKDVKQCHCIDVTPLLELPDYQDKEILLMREIQSLIIQSYSMYVDPPKEELQQIIQNRVDNGRIMQSVEKHHR